MNTAAAELFEAARMRQMYCILEQVIAPHALAAQLYDEEYALWPEWQDASGVHADTTLAQREQQEWHLADGIIAGSQFVVDGLVALGVPQEKCHVVPYAVDPGLFAPPLYKLNSWQYRAKPLNVLFVGSVDLRKGIQYLFEALQLLNPDRFHVKVVGGMHLRPGAAHKLERTSELVGLVPRSAMPGLFHWADVFVLPSICEGSALATYEALASGVPVITTPNSGSAVRDGIDGFVIPNRDAQALAERLECLAQDPDLRVSMSRASREHALESLSWEAYAERLVAAVLSITARTGAGCALFAQHSGILRAFP